MIQNIIKDKPSKLFISITAFFVANALIAECTGSTVISQLVDSLIVVIIAFKIGKGRSWSTVLSISLLGYSYKFLVAVILTPVIYFAETKIENYVGVETARQMKLAAMGNE